MKSCTSCQVTKPLSDFFVCRAAVDGFMSMCKQCRKVRYGAQKRAHALADQERRRMAREAKIASCFDGSLEGEEWRVVPSAPYFFASSLGRVMIAPHVKPTSLKNTVRAYVGKPTFGKLRKGRYYIRRDGKNYKVHRLVCEAFHGAATDSSLVCMHLDENSENNLASNLAWGTQRENLNAPGFKAYCRARVGPNSAHHIGKARRQTAEANT